jgi:hypothetical protein
MTNYQKLTIDECIIQLIESYKQTTLVSLTLYKGINREGLDDFCFLDPNIFIRHSKTLNVNGNAYNLLLNNLNSWKYFPIRENSIITSSNITTAQAFAQDKGKTYVVLPKYNIPIAIAPSSDIWFAFRLGLGQLSLRGNFDLVSFNRFLNEIIKAAQIPQNYDSTWELFVFYLEKLANEEIKPLSRIEFEAQLLLDALIRNKSDIIEYIDKAFSPSFNNIWLKHYNSELMAKAYPNNEIWIQSPCLLIENKKYFEILPLLEQKIKER